VKLDELSPDERACLLEQLPSLLGKFTTEAHDPDREVAWEGKSDWNRVIDFVLLARFLAEER
jgi:hypothetical protein